MPVTTPRYYNAGQVVRRTGATPRQLRYWDQVGIAEPSYQATRGTPGRPRLYAPEDVRIIARISCLLRNAPKGVTLQRFRGVVDQHRRMGQRSYPDAVYSALALLEGDQGRGYLFEVADAMKRAVGRYPGPP